MENQNCRATDGESIHWWIKEMYLSNGLSCDTRSQIDLCDLHIRCSFFALCKECLCMIHTGIPRLMQWLHSGRSSTNWMLHKSELSIHMVNYMCVYMAVQLISRLFHTGTWLAAALLSRPLCYCLAVFFYHLHLIVLSLSQGKIWHAFQKCYFFNYYFTSLKFCKSEIAWLEIA
jgi:hypothetical protein